MLIISVVHSFSLMSRYAAVSIILLFFLMSSDIQVVPVLNFYG